MANDTVVVSKSNINNYVVTGEWSISCGLKPELGSKESKKVTLVFMLENTPLLEIIGSSLKDKKINWQNSNRDKFESIKDGSVIKVNYAGGRQPIDQEAQTKAYLASLSPEERKAFIAKHFGA